MPPPVCCCRCWAARILCVKRQIILLLKKSTVLPAQVVRGQPCRGVRLRTWLYQDAQAQPRKVWRYSDEKVWFRADNSLLWEVSGQTLQPTNMGQKLEVQPTLLEVRQLRINPALDADAFVYQLPAGLRAPGADERFWSRDLRIGALPVTKVDSSAFEARWGAKTAQLSTFVGRPVVLWFGFPTDDGDLPVARQLARDWTPYGVQIVAVQMGTRVEKQQKIRFSGCGGQRFRRSDRQTIRLAARTVYHGFGA